MALALPDSIHQEPDFRWPGLLSRWVIPLLWQTQGMVVANLRAAHREMSSIPPALPDREPLPMVEGYLCQD